MLLGLLLFTVALYPFSAPCVCGRDPGTTAPVLAGLAVIVIRVVIAMLRKERSRVWIFYVALALALPLIATLIIQVAHAH
ncbi:MAG: hypothetical protein IBJ10_05435 [Phycisphaerales bacterium]|nr:hypothetical protein [Phycisphaerales bacterium]